MSYRRNPGLRIALYSFVGSSLAAVIRMLLES